MEYDFGSNNFSISYCIQGVSEGSQLSNHCQLPQIQGDQNPMSSELKYDYQVAANGQISQREYMEVRTSRETEDDSVNPSVAGEHQVVIPL